MAAEVESGYSTTWSCKTTMVLMILMLTYLFSWQIPTIRANRIAFTLPAHISFLQNIPLANIGSLLINFLHFQDAAFLVTHGSSSSASERKTFQSFPPCISPTHQC
jgi:hypothetical protein